MSWFGRRTQRLELTLLLWLLGKAGRVAKGEGEREMLSNRPRPGGKSGGKNGYGKPMPKPKGKGK